MADESGTFKGLVIGFLLFGLFGFLVLTAVADLSSEYNKDTSDIFSNSLNITSYSDYLEDAQATAEDQSEQYQESSPFSVLVEIVASGIWYVSLGFLTIVTVPLDLLQGVVYLVIGDNSLADIVAGSLYVLVTVTLIFGIWRVLKSGD